MVGRPSFPFEMASIFRCYLPFRGGQLLYCNQSISLPKKKQRYKRAVPTTTALGEPVSHIGIGCGAKVERWIFKILWRNQLGRKTSSYFSRTFAWKMPKKKLSFGTVVLPFCWCWNCWMLVCASSRVGFPNLPAKATTTQLPPHFCSPTLPGKVNLGPKKSTNKPTFKIFGCLLGVFLLIFFSPSVPRRRSATHVDSKTGRFDLLGGNSGHHLRMGSKDGSTDTWWSYPCAVGDRWNVP